MKYKYLFETRLNKFNFGDEKLVSIHVVKRIIHPDNDKICEFYVVNMPHAKLINNEYIINLVKIYNSPQVMTMLLEERYIEPVNIDNFVYKLGSRALLELL